MDSSAFGSSMKDGVTTITNIFGLKACFASSFTNSTSVGSVDDSVEGRYIMTQDSISPTRACAFRRLSAVEVFSFDSNVVHTCVLLVVEAQNGCRFRCKS